MLFEGQTVLVQVIKDPINSKGARLSTQISLAGRFLVHLPQDDHIGISQRIENEEERNSLRERLNALLPEQACHGYIIRTSAETATDAECLNAFLALSREEGIIPALESAHAVAYALRRAAELDGSKRLLVNLSGRGDKDIDFVLGKLDLA